MPTEAEHVARHATIFGLLAEGLDAQTYMARVAVEWFEMQHAFMWAADKARAKQADET